MKKRFTEEQIIGVLKEGEAGLKPAELCRSMTSKGIVRAHTGTKSLLSTRGMPLCAYIALDYPRTWRASEAPHALL
jgi:hypothetical protein